MRVAVFGAGYAGLTLARRLERRLRDAVEIVVVDEEPTHLVQHQLHRVVRYPSLADDLSVPLSEALERATVEQARVTGIDPERGVATLADGELSYDVGAVCLGAETNFHGLSGVEAHATPLKRLEHAETIRTDFLDLLAGGGRVVVGGAGLSGIQVAGELAALADEESAADAVEVVLLERLDAVAPNFPANFQAAVRAELDARGVEVRTNVSVAGADEKRVAIEGSADLQYDQFVWTGGIRGPDALAGDRPVVRNNLRLAGETFVLGDAARVVDADGEAVPASAQAAVREAGVAAENVERLLEHERDGAGEFEPRFDRFRFESAGWLVSVGDGAVAQVGPTVLRGPPAKAIKTVVGAGYLTSVGAVENAVEVVREELGFENPTPETDADVGRR